MIGFEKVFRAARSPYQQQRHAVRIPVLRSARQNTPDRAICAVSKAVGGDGGVDGRERM